MIKKVKRYFLELRSLDKKNLRLKLPNNTEVMLDNKSDFKINKFFYKLIGIDHYWRDRLIWTDKEWSKYASRRNLETWVMRQDDQLLGFYEQEYHPSKNEVELINMGILKEHRGKKLGSMLLAHSISAAFKKNPTRMWVHTCTLDHEYALYNYQSKGFKIFKEEEIEFVA